MRIALNDGAFRNVHFFDQEFIHFPAFLIFL